MIADCISHLAAERADLLGALASAGGDAWSRETRCAPWTVKDVLSHLVQTELDFGRVYRGEAAELSVSDASNEAGVEVWRALPGVAVRAALWQHGTAAQRVIEALPADDWRRPVDLSVSLAGGTGKEQASLEDVLRRHLLEMTRHADDLLAALEMPPGNAERRVFVAAMLEQAPPSAAWRIV